MIDLSFNASTMAMLKSLVGKTFERYSCDRFIHSAVVYGITGFYIGGKCYKMTSDYEGFEYFFEKDEATVMSITPCQPSEIVTQMVNGQLIETPVQDRIVRIDVVNDLDGVTHDGIRKEVRSTKGFVFYLASGNEISFEIETWFSALIHISHGNGLVEQFTPLTKFLEDWRDGYIPDSKREIVTLR